MNADNYKEPDPPEVPQEFEPGSRLSKMVSEWHKLIMDEIECHADVDAWYAPSECHGLVGESFDKERKRFFQKWNTTEEEFRAEVVERTSGKWAYFHLNL